MKRVITVLLLISFSSSFAHAQKYHRPKVEAPDTYRGAEAPPTDVQAAARAKWFDVFNDAQLQDLIREALTHNYDLREAVANIDAARASLGLTRSDQFPTIGVSSDVTVERLSREGAFTLPEPVKRDRTFGSVLLNLFTWEIDLFGRLKKETAAARAEMYASQETRNFVMTTLVSDVAAAYFNLRELDFELEIANRTLASRKQSLRIIQLRQEYGVSNMLERRQAEELVYDASQTVPALEQAIEQEENYLSYLTGKNPQPISRGASLTEQQMPEVPEGLPSDLIERRPDIRAAEQQLIAANARIGAAKAAFFPRISLTGFFGFESAQLTELFNPARSVWGLLPQVGQPIFTGGRLKSNLRFTQAEQEAFLVNYQKTVHNAFREVSDSLVAHRKVREVRSEREHLVRTLRDRVRLAYMRYSGGVSNLLEALDADRSLFDAERSLAQARRDELLSVVQLYKALGGGWQ